jgi:hypothetical protein
MLLDAVDHACRICSLAYFPNSATRTARAECRMPTCLYACKYHNRLDINTILPLGYSVLHPSSTMCMHRDAVPEDTCSGLPSASPSTEYWPSTFAAEPFTNHVVLPQGTNWGRSRTDAAIGCCVQSLPCKFGLDLFLLSRMRTCQGTSQGRTVAWLRRQLLGKKESIQGSFHYARVRASAAMAFVTVLCVYQGSASASASYPTFVRPIVIGQTEIGTLARDFRPFRAQPCFWMPHADHV